MFTLSFESATTRHVFSATRLTAEVVESLRGISADAVSIHVASADLQDLRDLADALPSLQETLSHAPTVWREQRQLPEDDNADNTRQS